MIIRSVERQGIYHKILSKTNLDGEIEASSVIETSEGKNVENFTATDKEDFLTQCKGYIEEIGFNDKEYDYLDLSSIEDIDEQLKIIKDNPDDFSSWDLSSDEPRKIRTNNPFLLDD